MLVVELRGTREKKPVGVVMMLAGPPKLVSSLKRSNFIYCRGGWDPVHNTSPQ